MFSYRWARRELGVRVEKPKAPQREKNLETAGLCYKPKDRIDSKKIFST